MDPMNTTLPCVARIEPAVFEEELRRGDDVVVVDTRARADFATWHVNAGRSAIVNVPEAELVANPEGALAARPADAPLRIICNAGNAFGRAAAALEDSLHEVRSVRGGLIGWSRRPATR